MSKRVFILGSTGSIGRSTIKVIQHLNAIEHDAYKVVGLAAKSSHELLLSQAKLLDVEAISLETGGVSYKHVTQSAVQLLSEFAQEGDVVVAAMVGFAGIEPVLKAIELGCDVALANKETLVAAGELIMDRLKKSSSSMIPVDSEHSAIYQALHNSDTAEVNKIILTASGGSLRDFSTDEVKTATVEQVLNHPTWDMGNKVTVDSASLMNKGLELIEAKWLFDVSAEQLEAVIHPQSIVHGIVEYADGSTIAQLSPPSMLFPIQYALTQPSRRNMPLETVNWSECQTLEFMPIDIERYPSIQLAKHVIEMSGTSGAVLNAANEVAVLAFLENDIPFYQIFRIVEQVLEATSINTCDSLQNVIEADSHARERTLSAISAFKSKERVI